MYLKLMFYASLLITSNGSIYGDYYDRNNNWSKLGGTYQWFDSISFENLLFLNESTFDEHPMPQHPFSLKIDKSSIPSIQLKAFKNCYYMRGAFLSEIGVNTISPGVFDGLEFLAEIDLSKNKLTKVEDGLFNKVKNLKYLDLSYNYIENISEQSFLGLKKLNYLYLQGNEISLLHNNLFESQVNSLLKLDISSNRLREINATFKGMSLLTHLFLQKNDISDIGADSFKNLTSLQSLDVSNNSIQHIEISGLEKLNNLSLQSNKIEFLDEQFFNSQKKSLSILNISSSGLKEINSEFHGMNQLTHIYLQVNKIALLARNSFQNLSSLQHLDLSHNYIQDLHEYIFSGSEKITHLYLNNNMIMFLDSNLFESQKHSLMFLSLSSNILREISTEFRGLSHLTNLYLQENQISSIVVDSFQGVNSLEYLDISHNNLERFQYGLVDHLDHLMYLNFSYNKFDEFPLKYLSYLTFLKELSFANNKIKYLNETEILHYFPSLHKISFTGNFNWSCARLVTFVKELRVHKIEVVKGNHFTGHNVRGMACYAYDSISSDKDSKGKNTKELNTKIEKANNEVKAAYSDKNIKDLINVIEDKHDNGNTFVSILLAISTVALIAMTLLQFYLVIKLKRKTHEEQLELL